MCMYWCKCALLSERRAHHVPAAAPATFTTFVVNQRDSSDRAYTLDGAMGRRGRRRGGLFLSTLIALDATGRSVCLGEVKRGGRGGQR